ncbi:MAG: hypothetical protein HY751_01765 [Nitrospinae bacterium]|nr:hypothetical protein [Nitrospinota bacterium]
MKFLFAIQNTAHFLNYRRVAESLCAGGHNVVFHLEYVEKPWANLTERPLADLKDKYPDRFGYSDIIRRNGFWRKALFTKREMANYGGYLRKENPIATSNYTRERAEAKMPPRARQALSIAPIRKLAFSKAGWAAMDFVENVAPLEKRVMDYLRREKPDLVVASPYIFPHSEQIDYIKCAKALNIPTVVGIASWDNLTTKGLFQVYPDSVFVWNQPQVEELKNIHGVSPEQAFTTGAPSLDIWFELTPKLSYEEFCRESGVDPGKDYIVYLCSSKSIIKREDEFIRKLAESLKARMGDNSPVILARPHPEHTEVWNDNHIPGVAVYPSRYDAYYDREAKGIFYHTLYHGKCVMGINTTAIIEAAIVSRPCISVTAPEYADTHTGSSHFHHLLNAGFIDVASGFESAVELVAGAIAGKDGRKTARRDFVGSFVRPWGLETPASAIMAHALINLAEGKTLSEVKALAGSGALVPAS